VSRSKACRSLFATDRQIFSALSLSLEPGQRVGLIGHSGGGKSTLFALLQRSTMCRAGAPDRRAGYRARHAGQPALAIAVVPADVSMFHRSIMEKTFATAGPTVRPGGHGGGVNAQCDEFIAQLPRAWRQSSASRPEAFGRAAPAHRDPRAS